MSSEETSEKKRLLAVRARQKKRKPNFKRYDSQKKNKIPAGSWRRPRGLHNKLRRHVSAKGGWVKSGYGSPKAVRGLHPCGLEEVLVLNLADIEKIDPKTQAACISSNIGAKKKEQIKSRAKELGLKVLNPGTNVELKIDQ